MTPLNLMPYQVQGADFLANRDRAGLHDEKTCSRCGVRKPATTEFFGRMAAKRDGLAPHCKTCIALWDRERRPPATSRRKGVRMSCAEIKRRYRARHPDRIKEQNRRQNEARIKTGAASAYNSARYRNDITFRLKVLIRTRTRKALKGINKSAQTSDLLGCTFDELRLWLEAHFLEGMSFDNIGEWEVDHIRPLAAFDLSDEAQLRAAAHYTNLQPLWRSDNRRKGAKCL